MEPPAKLTGKLGAVLSRLRFSRPSNPERLTRQQVFSRIYSEKLWGELESVSGAGSGVARTSLFRSDFEALLRELRVTSLLDAACGDFNWLPTFDLGGMRVIGFDIVPAIVAANRRRNVRPGTRFLVGDIVTDRLPRADLILCRDGLVHLSNADVLKALGNFRRSADWLLTNTFVDHRENVDIGTGDWRPLNLELHPFNLPPPVRMIDEKCLGYEGVYRDKRLALWARGDLPSADA